MTIPSTPFAVFFAIVITIVGVTLVRWHFQKDHFDLRDAITAPGTDGVRRVDTSKSILVGSFLVSSYWVSDNYSDAAMSIYLGAWVINGGAVLAFKAFGGKPEDKSVLK